MGNDGEDSQTEQNDDLGEALEVISRAASAHAIAAAADIAPPSPAVEIRPPLDRQGFLRRPVRILEEPKDQYRFRYESENRSCLLQGVNSTAENPTSPTIEICIERHRAKGIVMISCVADDDLRQHPHKVVDHVQSLNSAEHVTRGGVYLKKVYLRNGVNLVTLKNIGILCLKKCDINDAIQHRKRNRIDPFRKGFEKYDFNQNAVRLGIQVFLESKSGKFDRPLPPIASQVIRNDLKLKISYIVPSSGSIRGDNEVALLCKPMKGTQLANIQVLIYVPGQKQSRASINQIHSSSAIVITMPPYPDPSADKHVEVFIELSQLLGDQEVHSNAVPYEYQPTYPGTTHNPPPTSLESCS